ncbi:MAG: hypothetical protein V2G42_03660 [bacterium JZ-2024 1]
MRQLNHYVLSWVAVAGSLAVFAFAGVVAQGGGPDPEEEFFREVPLDQVVPGMPTGEMPMMPGMAPGGPPGPPAGFPPGGPPCMMKGAPPMMRGSGMMDGPEPRFPMGHDGAEHRFSVFHLLSHPLHHADEFALTNEERKALVGLREKILYPAVEKEKALEASRFAFADTMGQPDFDAGKARDIAKKIAGLENDLRELTITAATEVRKILGPERYAKLFRLEEHRSLMMRMMMHREGPGPGGHEGPREPRTGPPPDARHPAPPPPR